MRTDRYTKVILTIIAVCLVWISLRDFIPSQSAQAQANRGAQNVVITGIKIPDKDYPETGITTIPVRGMVRVANYEGHYLDVRMK